MLYPKILTMLLCITLIHCTNPFSTREPEKPDSGSQVYDNATEPKIVLENMIMAIKEKNVNEYKKIFVSDGTGNQQGSHTFKFEPEPSLSEYFISKWTQQDEESYFNNLVSTSSGNYPILKLSFNVSDYSFTPIISGSESDSVRTNSMQYVFTVNPGDSTKVYTGNAEFKLFRSEADQFWYIYYWQDNAIDQNYNETWTNLKIQNYLGK